MLGTARTHTTGAPAFQPLISSAQDTHTHKYQRQISCSSNSAVTLYTFNPAALSAKFPDLKGPQPPPFYFSAFQPFSSQNIRSAYCLSPAAQVSCCPPRFTYVPWHLSMIKLLPHPKPHSPFPRPSAIGKSGKINRSENHVFHRRLKLRPHLHSVVSPFR